jgi:hypothetical protein
MTGNQSYDSMSLIRYQTSLLSLAAALDEQGERRVAIGPKEQSLSALFEAERLKDLVDRSGL